MCNYVGTRKGICSYSLVYNFLIWLLLLEIPVFVVQFSNSFWHGNEAFLKVVHKMKLFLSVLQLCRSCRISVTRVALVSLVSGTRAVN